MSLGYQEQHVDRFNALEAFVGVIEEDSFAGAARRLGLSRSQVSRLVAQLEDRLGAQLLNRSTRQVSATSAGKAFFLKAKAIVDDLKEAESTVSAHQDTAIGKIRVNTPNSIPGVNFSRAIIDFMVQYPALEVELTMENRIVDPVADGFDLVVRIAEPDEETGLVDHRILQLEYGMYCSSEYAEREGVPETPEDLTRHHILDFARSAPTMRWAMTGPDGDLSVRVKPRLIANHREAIYEAVRQHLGVAIMPEFSVKPHVEDGSLVRVLPDYHCQLLMLQVIYPPARHLSTKVRLLTDFLIERFSRQLH